jgi:hypothetical protein
MVAKAGITVYNRAILNKTTRLTNALLTPVAVLTVFLGIALSPAASAQSTLQNTNTGLQPQAGQTQNSVNTQSQVGGVQQNNGQSVLNQKSGGSLGVVSSPEQSKPEATAAPSTTLKTDLTQATGTNKAPWIAVVVILAVIASAYIARRPGTGTKTVPVAETKPAKPVKAASAQRTETPSDSEEPEAKPRKKKKQARKKRKKSNQR